MFHRLAHDAAPALRPAHSCPTRQVLKQMISDRATEDGQ